MEKIYKIQAGKEQYFVISDSVAEATSRLIRYSDIKEEEIEIVTLVAGEILSGIYRPHVREIYL